MTTIRHSSGEKFYGRRRGRTLSSVQIGVMHETLSSYTLLLPEQEDLDLPGAFQVPYEDYALEIGFGGGEHLAAFAEHHPKTGVVGSEVFLNGVASCAGLMRSKKLENILIYPHDVRPLLRGFVEGCLNTIFILFPDPWPKARHHKRRLINDLSLPLFWSLLKDGGAIRIASDDKSYLSWILETFEKSPLFIKTLHAETRPKGWYPTRYEQKALAQGKKCIYLVYDKKEFSAGSV